ncbi:hypothetical protein [Verrucomicrobium spinosum]|uniref:hypothetical protein n=1 Tax=Verrucomicrobium spinosum TaxID=2736 RepID=UPI0009467BC2
MKTQSSILTRWLPLALMLTVASARAQDSTPPLTDWRHVQNVRPAAAGLVRIEIPSTTHGAAQQNLSDLRLINPSGVETPFLLQWPHLETITTRAVSGFRARIDGDKTCLEMVPPPGESIRALTLETATPTFIKAVTLEVPRTEPPGSQSVNPALSSASGMAAAASVLSFQPDLGNNSASPSMIAGRRPQLSRVPPWNCPRPPQPPSRKPSR